MSTDDLDWSTEFAVGEWDALQAQYAALMGEGEVDRLFKFVPFMGRHAPEALKRYRLQVNTATQGVGLVDQMPNPPLASMMAGHFYSTIPYPHGIEADLFVAGRAGGKKQEVVDILRLAWLHSGMHGMNVAARVAEPLLEAWDPAVHDGAGLSWPDGWDVDPDAFRCGIDFSADVAAGATADDVEAIRSWHRRVQGQVPRYVEFFGRHHPLALKVFRARYETSTGGALPKQFIALCLFQLSVAWRQADAARRNLQMARNFGVAKDQAAQVLAYAQIYEGDIGIDATISAIEDVFDAWES